MIDYNIILDKYKDKAVEFALGRFTQEVDTINTSIGDIRPGYKTGPKHLIVTGIMVGNGENSISHILQSCDIKMTVSEKFKDMGAKTSIQILNEYVKDAECTNGDELINKLSDIIHNKQLIMPIKVGSHCTVIIETDDDRLIKKNLTVGFVRWNINRETGLMESFILSDSADMLIKVVKVNIVDYLKKFFLTDIERAYNDSSKDITDVIEMTPHGYIKPIKFKCKKYNVIIDNCFMYIEDKGQLNPIAYWSYHDELIGNSEFKRLKLTKDYKEHISQYITYIDKHRRFIGPAVLTEAKEVKLN